MGFKKITKPAKILSVALGGILPVLVSATVWSNSYKSLLCSTFLGGQTSKIINNDENAQTEYYKTNGQSIDEWIKSEEEIERKVQAEGTVLLKNKNNALPLSVGAKVSAFGYGTINSISTGMVRYGSPAPYISFKDGMENDGNLKINPSLYNFYSTNSTAKLAFNTVSEVDVSLMKDADRADYNSYGEAAIIVISRSGGEGGDLSVGDFAGGKKFLSLQDSEKAMIQEAKSHFKKVVVLLNTSYAFELSFLDEYDIDACLMIGAVGHAGFKAVSDILVGKVNPSGKTVDTFAADSLSSPASVNFGDYTYQNSEEIVNELGAGANATKYVVEAEGIYVGYKYYETRYEDSILKQGNATSSKGAFKDTTWNYEKEVVYPFGYGLSYTTFSETLKNVEDKGDSFLVNVEVKNTGNTAGRHSVQVYAQTPYTDFDKQNKIEVASVQLAGFEKTKTLGANESETLSIKVKKDDLAHYDSYVNKTYIMEAGNYYLSIGENVHDALNNILSKKGAAVNGNSEDVYQYSVSSTDTKTYSKTSEGVQITNIFDDIDLNYFQENAVTYLSRNDWNGTWPKEYTSLSANAAMKKALNIEGEYQKGSSDLSEYTLGAKNDYTVAMMREAEFDDSHWKDILDELSVEDLVTLCGRSGLVAVESIAYPSTFMKDGSHRVSDRTYLDKTDTYAYTFPSAVIMASSYDRDLMYEIGQAFGEDNLRTGTTGHYAPSVNIHRTPYSGRNFEYFSEDGYLSGEMAVPSIKGMQEKGAIPFLKHFAGNEQETNRQGVSTFINQQAFREIYLEGFHTGIVEGEVKGLMGGFNRIGCTWTGASRSLQYDLLRREWNSTAISDTDAVFSYNTSMGFKAGLEAGTTMWATSGAGIYDKVIEDCKTDAKLVGYLRDSAHYLLYNVVNSMAFNNISSTSKIVAVNPWWLTTIIAIDWIVGGLFVVSLAGAVAGEILKGKKEEEK